MAIEAAALLHDMGKLAVPEHILNKPGKLTASRVRPDEDARVGRGARFSRTIDFPYPVVPIVRHHHENWDGTGYPDGLRGADIPLGARIMAVVDCYDALTSDRPYRPALSDEEATRDHRGAQGDDVRPGRSPTPSWSCISRSRPRSPSTTGRPSASSTYLLRARRPRRPRLRSRARAAPTER